MILNRRDLGGISTEDGRIIRRGLLIRSANLADAVEADLEGISAVIDLRTPAERRQMPDKTYGREYLPLPLFEELRSGVSHEEGAENSGIPELAPIYRQLVTECEGAFRTVLLRVMRHDFSGGAILWHCTEGKDRCGITTALLLEALGVEREAILRDYLRTNETNLPKAAAIREQLTGTHGAAFAKSVYLAYIADESYLRAAWEAMGEDYLTRGLGLAVEEIEAFRTAVLEKE